MSEDAFRRWYFYGPDAEPFRLAGNYLEPVDGVDAAERSLRQLGKPGESYIELRLNGDPEPHTVVFYLEDGNFGIWNTEFAKWPVFYAEHEGEMYDGNPFIEDEDSEDEIEGDDEQEDAEREEDDDSEIMQLGGEEDEEDDDTEPEEEDGEDEEDDPLDDDDGGAGEEDDDGDDDDFTLDENTDDEDEGENEIHSELEGEEDEMPRVKLFSKFRGPLGWRKRAESEELEEFNVFEMVVGTLDDQAEKPKDQERDQLVRANFVESVRSKSEGLFCVELPEGIQMVQDPEMPTLWFATIPYDPDERN